MRKCESVEVRAGVYMQLDLGWIMWIVMTSAPAVSPSAPAVSPSSELLTPFSPGNSG